MATHSGILSWKIPGTEEPVGYSPWGHKELDTTERFSLSLHFRMQICEYLNFPFLDADRCCQLFCSLEKGKLVCNMAQVTKIYCIGICVSSLEI